MEHVLSIAIGCLFGVGCFLLMQGNLVRVLLGMLVLGQAANLLVFASAGLRKGAAPILQDGPVPSGDVYADPLPQALVLTAIVIGFALIAFSIALLGRVTAATGTDDSADFLTEHD